MPRKKGAGASASKPAAGGAEEARGAPKRSLLDEEEEAGAAAPAFTVNEAYAKRFQAREGPWRGQVQHLTLPFCSCPARSTTRSGRTCTACRPSTGPPWRPAWLRERREATGAPAAAAGA